MVFDKGSFPPASHKAPLIELVSQLLQQAHEKRASDIHLEPLEKELRIRFRIDGVLNEVQRLPKKLERAIISRLKMMTGSMNIAERRLPQDGRFPLKLNNHLIDVRAATMPTTHGESMVLRLLDPASHLLGLSQLGLEADDQQTLQHLLQQPDGLLLITGPTGSGKTTTLYGCMKELQQTACKIITVEDPIEYRLAGINQVQVKEEIGLTFPIVLRAMLRQAPNKIVVGEIRDQETANMAITASLTGHLILSTLHANDAASTMARLQEMRVAPFMIASGVRAIIAQRLVRRLCPHCKEPTTWSNYEKKALGLKDHSNCDSPPMKPVGCSQCHKKGFHGRIGLFEIFILNEEIRRHLQNQQPFSLLQRHARAQGIRSLLDDGMLKIKAGLTTAQEVISNTLFYSH
ncbi:MAG: GspE/PulE family protein [Chthoniobacterales bacterium]|nr:GspE/PulE family protein [Chthoniobacterales bacterium]